MTMSPAATSVTSPDRNAPGSASRSDYAPVSSPHTARVRLASMPDADARRRKPQTAVGLGAVARAARSRWTPERGGVHVAARRQPAREAIGAFPRPERLTL